MRRSKHEDLPDNLTLDAATGRYRYRYRPTGKRSWLGKDRDAAIAQARRLNVAAEAHETIRLQRSFTPTLSVLIDLYVEFQVPIEPWGEQTRRNHLAALALYRRELGNTALKKLDRLVIARWIAKRNGGGDAMRRHRLRFVRLYDYAISQKWCNYNEAAATPKHSRSLKLAHNRVTRKRLTLPEFWEVHDAARPHLQVAMQLSLVTLQAEQEICWMQREHIRDGYLYVVRQKTAAESDAAFIRIRINPEIERVLRMSRLSKIVSPFFVHRIRRSVSPHQKYTSPHPTFVRPQALSEEYRIARDRAGVSMRYAAGEAPTFHEIRSLGSRLMREQGVDEGVISALLAHGKRSTTEIYLDGRDVVPDDRYIEVEATLVLKR